MPKTVTMFRGQRRRQLACEEVKRREYKFPKQFQLTGMRHGKRELLVGSLRQVLRFRGKWQRDGVIDLKIEERIEDEAGLNLKLVTI